jgi:DNA uptake protein ComE-like DNA-binding protein
VYSESKQLRIILNKMVNHSTGSGQSQLANFGQFSVIGALLLLGLLSGCTSAPEAGNTKTTPNGEASSAPKVAAAAAGKINVNSAPIAELDKLEVAGTKPSLSERIQGKRPYASPDDLVTKKAISAEEYKLIKDLITTGK